MNQELHDDELNFDIDVELPDELEASFADLNDGAGPLTLRRLAFESRAFARSLMLREATSAA